MPCAAFGARRTANGHASPKDTRQTIKMLCNPDPFRLKHRQAITVVVAAVVREKMSKAQAITHIRAYAQANVSAAERERFVATAENQLLSLHEGSIARYQLRQAEFQAWQMAWINT